MRKLLQPLPILLVALLILSASACNTPPNGANANSGSPETANANANSSMANSNVETPPASSPSTSFAMREPERYSLKMNVSLEGSADNHQGSMQLEIEFARMDANRMWTLRVPAINQEVTYLEKPGLKYLVSPTRKQYVEVTPDTTGFPLGDLMSPAGMMARLQSKSHEDLGTETINGRPATKYRFTGSANTGTTAGTAQADSFIFVDKETTLPLRIDLTATLSSGASARGIVETKDIHLNPDPGQFDIPIGFQKVSGDQLKQQVQSFIAIARALLPYLAGQNAPSVPPPAAAPATNSNGAAPNANAKRP